MVKAGGERSGCRPISGGARKDVLRVTHVRDSIDARAGGVLPAKYTAAAFTWGYCWTRRALKIAPGWRCGDPGNVDATHLYTWQVCYYVTSHKSLPLSCFHSPSLDPNISTTGSGFQIKIWISRLNALNAELMISVYIFWMSPQHFLFSYNQKLLFKYWTISPAPK